MATDTNDYTLGRGKLYFDSGDGERYIGNTPAVNVAFAYTNLEHYSSDSGIQVLDDAIEVRRDRSGSFTTDNISIDNVAVMFGSTAQTVAQSSSSGEAEVKTVKKGRFYQLGTDNVSPQGVRDLSSIVVTDNAGVRASGTFNFTGNPSNTQTATINGQVITFVTGVPTGLQVQIGATPTVTAQSFKELVNDNQHLFKTSAAGAAALITITALATGTAGNAITIARSGSFPAVSGTTLTGGTASGIITAPGNYEADLELGRIEVLSDSNSITDNMTVEIQYNRNSSQIVMVIDGNSEVRGALRYISDNAKGTNRDYFWPLVRLQPTGDHALKGDTWESMAFNFTVLKKPGQERTYINSRAAA